LDGPFPKLCPAVTLSHQDGHHSAVALLLKAALIQVSDYRLQGASGFCWHIKIYPPCNFEVNPITHFGVISLFSSNFQNFNTFRPLFQKL
jgi:hypothetical protein